MPVFLEREAYLYFLRLVTCTWNIIIIVGCTTWNLTDFEAACDHQTLFRSFQTAEL